MNIFNIERSFQLKAAREWDTLYVAIDLHGTVIPPYHHTIEFYPGAIEVLKWFNKRKDFKIILWTSSWWQETELFLMKAKKEGVHFDFVNENPLEKNRGHACFDRKFYMNIILDDKAGFVGETDWALVKAELIRIGEWRRRPKWKPSPLRRS